MKKKIIYISYFLFVELNLFCMNDSSEIFDINKEKNLECLKEKNVKRRAVFAEILYEGSNIKSDFNSEPIIGKIFETNFEKALDNKRFFSFKTVKFLDNLIIFGHNNLVKNKINIKKLKIQPFNSPTWCDSKRDENYSKSMQYDNNIGDSKECIDSVVSDNFVSEKNSIIYEIKLSNHAVKIIKQRNNKVVFFSKLNGYVTRIGASVYFSANSSINKNLYGIEHVLISCLSDKNNYIVYLYDKDSRIIFEKELDKNFCSYELIEYGKNRFIAFIYDKNVEIFDVASGKKVKEGPRESFVFWAEDENFENRIFSVDDIDSAKPSIGFLSCTWSVISALVVKNYIIFLAGCNKSGSLNFAETGKLKFIKPFTACIDDTFGVEKFDYGCQEELYCWKKDRDCKHLEIYGISQDGVRIVFDRNFSDVISNFKIDKNKDCDCCRNISVNFLDHEKNNPKKFEFCFLGDNCLCNKDDFKIVNL